MPYDQKGIRVQSVEKSQKRMRFNLIRTEGVLSKKR